MMATISFEGNLDKIADVDVKTLLIKNAEYGSSWSKRGGAGAFFMLARKFDRIEQQCKDKNYDLFAVIEGDRRAEGIMDDIRDLRRYLLLVEEHFVDAVTPPSPSEITDSMVRRAVSAAEQGRQRGNVNPRGFDVQQDCRDYDDGA